jgi:aminopeptidase N
LSLGAVQGRSLPAPHRALRSTLLAAALLGTSGCGLWPFGGNGGGEVGPPTSEPAPIEAAVKDPPGRYDQPLDVLRYDVELALPDSASWFLGRTRIRVARSGETPEGLVLDLTGLAVDTVRVAGRVVEATLEGGRLTVPLPAGARDELDVEVVYRGVPDDGLAIAPDVHEAPAVFADNWPNRARFWFPSLDHPSDKALVRFTVHAPAAWQVIANGSLMGDPEATAGGVRVPDVAPRRTWRWETRTPIPTYTMVIGAGTLANKTLGLAACGQSPASSRGDRCTEVSWWVSPSDTVTANRVFRRAPQMVDFFTRYFGDFPYEKLANVQSATRFGGMENSSAIFYSGQAIAQGQDIEGTVSHEIVHQWFGDSVTPRDWSELWLSEGFATYFGAMFFEQADGRDAFLTQMDRVRERYLASDDTDKAMVDTETQNLYDLLNRNSYEKGALVLHMLRGQLGDSTFHEGIREYYRQHTHGNATTADLRAAFEQASRQNLETFFEQWTNGRGYPVFRTSQGYVAERREAILVVTQIQSIDWPRFQMPLDVVLYWNGGSRRERVNIVNAREVFTFANVPAALTRVEFDPDRWMLYQREGGGR